MLQKILVSSVLLVLLLVEKGSSSCYTSSGCTGSIVPAVDARDCCVGTNDGQSYGVDPDDCQLTQCIVHGFRQAVYDVVEGDKLMTDFDLNIKGAKQTPAISNNNIIVGVIEAVLDGTANITDVGELPTIDYDSASTDDAEINFFTKNDQITLEYEDRILLTFTPLNEFLIPGVEDLGEYIRDTAIVNIIDSDRLEINFEEDDYSITEDGLLRTTIRFQFRQNQNPFTVLLCPVSIDEAENRDLGFFFESDTIIGINRATPGSPDGDFSDDCMTVMVPAAVQPGPQTFPLPEFYSIVDDEINEVEQSFALVATVGDDVTATCDVNGNISECSCFQTGVGETDCFGRSGATQIIISDNDFMVIGFTEESQYVSENEVPGVDKFPVFIDLATLRVSERLHTMLFRLLSNSSATVVSFENFDSEDHDARFGSKEVDPIEDIDFLMSGDDRINPLRTQIVNDFIPEDEECFTIKISPFDIPGFRELFMCDFVDVTTNPPTNYFCLHTICIKDDDSTSEPPSKPSPSPTPGVNTEPTDPSTTTTSDTDNTAAIIGGVVTVVVILIIAITVTVIVAMVLKNCRHGDVSIKNSSERHELSVLSGPSVEGASIPTFTNMAYGRMKQGPGIDSEGYEMIDVAHRRGRREVNIGAAYEVPSVPDQPLPDIPSPHKTCQVKNVEEEEEDRVYETIPGDDIDLRT